MWDARVLTFAMLGEDGSSVASFDATMSVEVPQLS